MISRGKRNFVAMLAGILISTSLAGCGSSHDATVHGVVSLDGMPLANVNGEVQFHSVAESGTAYGRLDATGNYELQTGSASGLDPGEYNVTVVGREPFPDNLPAGTTPPIPKLLTPERYGSVDTTPFKFTVTDGDNTIDLALTTKNEPRKTRKSRKEEG